MYKLKPRIFINMHYMAIGGAERALLGLLNALDPSRVQVDLFLNQHSGEFMPLIPEWVNVLPSIPAYTAIERPIKTVVREGHWRIAAARLWAKLQHCRYYKALPTDRKTIDTSIFQFINDAVVPHLPSLEYLGEYDLAISFHYPHSIVADKVSARRKLAWIHTDYAAINVNVEKDLAVWSKYDNIVSISPDCTRSFIQVFPSLTDSVIVIENILSSRFILQQADEGFANEMIGIEGVKLLSIGRVCHAKNYDNVPYIAAELRHLGIDFTWWIIGPGSHDDIDKRSSELGVANRVVFLGSRTNPYPYIKACDVYLQPSRYEGKSVTVREAQILCKPVIITNYATSSSQIKDGIDGIVVPMDNVGCAAGIANALSDLEKMERIRHHLSTYDYGNEIEVDKIYALIDA